MTISPNLHVAKQRIEEIFAKYNGSGQMAPVPEFISIVELCDRDTLIDLMREVDPQRAVFDTPVTKDEVGLHGLPLTTNSITYCSTLYGTETSIVDGRIPESFLTLVEEGFMNGDLHGCGCLIWHKLEDTHGFLIIEAIERDAVPVQSDMDDLADRLGVKVACYSDPSFDKDAQVCLTAFVTTPEGLMKVAGISQEISDLAQAWFSSAQ